MNIIPESKITEFKNFIQNHNYFYIVGHKEPDGDCIASCLGIAEILKKFNKDYLLLSAGPFKRNEISKYEKLFTNEMPFQNEEERQKTGLIITDCSEIKRLGEIEGDFKGLDIYIIDHHKTSDVLDNSQGYINPNSPACAYLIQLFYEELVGLLSEVVAKIIFLGTGSLVFIETIKSSLFLGTSSLVFSASSSDFFNSSCNCFNISAYCSSERLSPKYSLIISSKSTLLITKSL